MTRAGVRISIDGFGSGYSDFGYLSDLPIHTIKIDKSLIDGVAKDPRSRAKVSTIHQLAHELGYLTVAEGVEHRDQLDVLKRLGFDQIQGYLLATPAPASKVAELFETVDEQVHLQRTVQPKRSFLRKVPLPDGPAVAHGKQDRGIASELSTRFQRLTRRNSM